MDLKWFKSYGLMHVIVASATPWGHSALALVRFSGANLVEVIEKVAKPHGSSLPHNQARRVDLTDSRGVFDGLVLYARGPKSYAEDTAEITCHETHRLWSVSSPRQ